MQSKKLYTYNRDVYSIRENLNRIQNPVYMGTAYKVGDVYY